MPPQNQQKEEQAPWDQEQAPWDQAQPNQFQPIPVPQYQSGLPDLTTWQGAKQAGIGAAKTGLQTLAGIGEMPLQMTTNIGKGIHWAGEKIHPGLGERIIPQAGLEAEQYMATPENTAQTVGKIGAEMGSFLVPGAGEEAGPALAASLGPRIAQAGRVGLNALQAGTLNKLQGGTFTGGAVASGLGEGVGQLAKWRAPKFFETGMNVAQYQRAFGKTPGITGLAETTGRTPEAVGASATQAIEDHMNEIENLAFRRMYAGPAGTPTYPPMRINLRPALKIVDDAIQKARSEQDVLHEGQYEAVRDALTKDRMAGGSPLLPDQDPLRAIAIKRGLRRQFISNWKNPELMENTRGLARDASAAVDKELDRALGPEFQQRNQSVSSLIPLEENAAKMSRMSPFEQLIRSRMRAHTGALTGAVGGSIYGGHREGPLGALKYGALGVALPEILASPSGYVTIGRALQSPVIPRLATSAALTLRRPEIWDQR